MKFKFLLAYIWVVPLLVFAEQGDVIIRPQIGEQTRLAVADFSPRVVALQETESALKVFNQVLENDLKFSAIFRMSSKSFYPLKRLRFPEDVEFENWQVPSLDVDFLVFGNLQLEAHMVVVEAYLYDVKTRQQVLGKRYTTTDRKLTRRLAHEFADQVVFQLSAGSSRGVALSQIAYTSRRGKSKEIYVMDYDGADARTITANGGINKFPNWGPDNDKLAFVTNLPGSSQWELWIQDLRGGRNVFPVSGSYVSSPAIAPDGKHIAFSGRSSRGVDSDIYVGEINGSDRRNLTNHPGIDTSAAWSPTGRQVAFISDRSGTPQVWVMDADGSNVERLVLEGGHCDSPDWSPDGRFIAYSWQAPTQWKHNVYIIEVATGKILQLTSGTGSNENPHWSPDGYHIVFQSSRTGLKQIFIMNADGKNLKQVTAYGINGSPSWSGYRVTGP